MRYAEKLGVTPYIKNATKWWDGYQGEDVVIFDEWRGAMDPECGISYSTLLQITGRLVIWIERKGGMVPLTSTTFIFTSPFHPKDWYTYANQVDCYSQFERRMMRCSKFTVPYVFPGPRPKRPAEHHWVPDIAGVVDEKDDLDLFEEKKEEVIQLD